MDRISRTLWRIGLFSAVLLQPGCMMDPTGPEIERQPGGTRITDPKEPARQRQSPSHSAGGIDSAVTTDHR